MDVVKKTMFWIFMVWAICGFLVLLLLIIGSMVLGSDDKRVIKCNEHPIIFAIVIIATGPIMLLKIIVLTWRKAREQRS